MWFENAIGSEKIKFMFNDEFIFQQVELLDFSMTHFSNLKFHFCSKDVPAHYPQKWSKQNFNALSLTLTFSDLIQLDITGSKIGFFCFPEISILDEYAEIKIKHHDFDLYCKARFLTIESITPYLDERWD